MGARRGMWRCGECAYREVSAVRRKRSGLLAFPRVLRTMYLTTMPSISWSTYCQKANERVNRWGSFPLKASRSRWQEACSFSLSLPAWIYRLPKDGIFDLSVL